MPGGRFAASCSCGRQFTISTGAGRDRQRDVFWGWHQLVCKPCGSLTSVQSFDLDADGSAPCPSCGAAMTPWTGTAGIVRVDPEPGAGPAAWLKSREVVEGPCPACGLPLRVTRTAYWD